jgi:hypothetical protein
MAMDSDCHAKHWPQSQVYFKPSTLAACRKLMHMKMQEEREKVDNEDWHLLSLVGLPPVPLRQRIVAQWPIEWLNKVLTGRHSQREGHDGHSMAYFSHTQKDRFGGEFSPAVFFVRFNIHPIEKNHAFCLL